MSRVMIETKEHLGDKLYMLNSHIQCQINQMKNNQLGKLLTIVDASISDKEQRKALKDIVKDAIWEKEYFSSEISQIIIQFAKKYNIQTKFLEEYYDRNSCENLATPDSQCDWFSDDN